VKQNLSRRRLLGLSAATGLALGSRIARAAPATGTGTSRTVFMDVDGLGLTPVEFAELVRKLSAGLVADEYSRGGEVEALETTFARMLGKERAVFLPSGTLANQLAVRRLAKGRSRVLVQAESHLLNDSGDCVERLSGLNLVPLAPGQATFTREDVEKELARTASGRVATGVGVISIESPVRRLKGALFDFSQMRAISGLARERGIGLHLDGARLIVASAYTGIAPADYAALFDTVYVSLWKSFSSGSGAILAGPAAELDDLYQDRRMFGGALHAGWPFAVVARHYAEGVLERLRAGIVVSEALVAALDQSQAFSFERVKDGTSRMRLTVRGVSPATYASRLEARGVILPHPEPDGSYWLTVNETWARMSGPALAGALEAAARGGPGG
jgi:threonine aldolase